MTEIRDSHDDWREVNEPPMVTGFVTVSEFLSVEDVDHCFLVFVDAIEQLQPMFDPVFVVPE